MSHASVEQGEPQLEPSRKQFVWRYGVLGWGLPTGALFAITRASTEGWEQLPILLPISLVLFPIGGLAVGHALWRWRERKDRAAAAER